MKISKSKKYRTRSGLPVRIYATDGTGDFSIHGAIKYQGGRLQDGWFMEAWLKDGICSSFEPYGEYDLIEIKPKRKKKKVSK